MLFAKPADCKKVRILWTFFRKNTKNKTVEWAPKRFFSAKESTFPCWLCISSFLCICEGRVKGKVFGVQKSLTDDNMISPYTFRFRDLENESSGTPITTGQNPTEAKVQVLNLRLFFIFSIFSESFWNLQRVFSKNFYSPSVLNVFFSWSFL